MRDNKMVNKEISSVNWEHYKFIGERKLFFYADFDYRVCNVNTTICMKSPIESYKCLQ